MNIKAGILPEEFFHFVKIGHKEALHILVQSVFSQW